MKMSRKFIEKQVSEISTFGNKLEQKKKRLKEEEEKFWGT